MSLCDLTKALTLAAVALDGGIVEEQWLPSDVPAFEAGAPHAGAHPLDDQVSLKFSNGADDDDDGSAQRATNVDIFPERDILDIEPAEFVENVEEVFHRPGDSI